MSQNRKAPSYQEYASDILAQLSFRTITLQDRGLLWTMRMECWVNRQLPNDPQKLSRALGLTIDQVAESLPAVMPFFKIKGEFILCPELENYREHLEHINRKKSEGGKNSAEKRAKEKINNSTNSISNDASSNLQDTCNSLESNLQDKGKSGVELSRVELSRVEQSQVQSLEKVVIKDPFIEEMEEYEVNEGINDKKRFMRI